MGRVVALSVTSGPHALAGSGALNLRSPTGGVEKGIEKYLQTALVGFNVGKSVPLMVPFLIVTMHQDSWALVLETSNTVAMATR